MVRTPYANTLGVVGVSFFVDREVSQNFETTERNPLILVRFLVVHFFSCHRRAEYSSTRAEVGLSGDGRRDSFASTGRLGSLMEQPKTAVDGVAEIPLWVSFRKKHEMEMRHIQMANVCGSR